MQEPAVPPTPPVPLAALLSREDLGLREVVASADPDVVIHAAQTSEMSDPYPYLLGGELLLTAGVHIPEASDEDAYFDGYVSRIVAAGGAALGFGVAPVRDTVPRALVAACERHGLPLVEVPQRTTFAAVGRAVWQLMAQARLAELRRVSQAQQSLAAAASSAEPVPAVLRRLAARLGGRAVLYGPEGPRSPRRAGSSPAGRRRPWPTWPASSPPGPPRPRPTRSPGSTCPPTPSAPPSGASSSVSRHPGGSPGTTPSPPSPPCCSPCSPVSSRAAAARRAPRRWSASCWAPPRRRSRPSSAAPGTGTARRRPPPRRPAPRTRHRPAPPPPPGTRHRPAPPAPGPAPPPAAPRRRPRRRPETAPGPAGAPARIPAPPAGTKAPPAGTQPPPARTPAPGCGVSCTGAPTPPTAPAPPPPRPGGRLRARCRPRLPAGRPAPDAVRVLVPPGRDPQPQPGWILGVSAPVTPRDWPAADAQAARALARARATRTPLVRHAGRPALADLLPDEEAEAHARALLAPLAAAPPSPRRCAPGSPCTAAGTARPSRSPCTATPSASASPAAPPCSTPTWTTRTCGWSCGSPCAGRDAQDMSRA